MRILILGGTTEASSLARRLAGDDRFQPLLSLAGRTSAPLPQPVPTRSGGFGGAEGLADFLDAEHIDAVIDATHPFAARITDNAVRACRQAARPLLAILRPEWTPQEGDRWQVVPSLAAAADALGAAPRRVLLTIGQLGLAAFAAQPHHHYVVRSVEPPDAAPPGAEIVTARGPFLERDEHALLVRHAIEVLVTKNSGGGATSPKLDAARVLGLQVVMVARPPLPATLQRVADAEAAMEWLCAHAGTPRGE